MTPYAWRLPAVAAVLILTAQPSTAAHAAPADSPAPGGSAPVTADGADLMSVSLAGDRLSVRFRDARQAATGAQGADPTALTLGTAGGLTAAVPPGPAYGFLGEPGKPVWSLSQGGSNFPSLDLTGVRPGTVEGGTVGLELVSAEGPGDFAMYTVDRWGKPTVLIDSDGTTSTRLPAGKRLGGVAWTFDAAGDYRLTFATSATTGGKNLTGTTTYAVQVPELPEQAPPAAAAPQENRAQSAQRQTTQQQAAPQQKEAQQGKQQATTQAKRKVISDGHVDMGPQLTGDTLRIKIKDDAASPPQWLELADVLLKVTDKAKIPVPSGAGYAFLGKTGDQVWMLPQTQQSGIVWPGWNTQHESITGGVSGTVTWTLKGVTGPGDFALFLTNSFGAPEVLFDSGKPLPQKLAIPLNTHAHGNWAFGKAGTYQLAVQMDARTKSGRTVTDTRTLTIAVGDATSTDVPAGNDGGGDAPAEKGGAADKKDTAAAGSGKTSSGSLAKTGANIATVIGAGALLVLVGIAAVRLGRRRNPTP